MRKSAGKKYKLFKFWCLAFQAAYRKYYLSYILKKQIILLSPDISHLVSGDVWKTAGEIRRRIFRCLVLLSALHESQLTSVTSKEHHSIITWRFSPAQRKTYKKHNITSQHPTTSATSHFIRHDYYDTATTTTTTDDMQDEEGEEGGGEAIGDSQTLSQRFSKHKN